MVTLTRDGQVVLDTLSASRTPYCLRAAGVPPVAYYDDSAVGQPSRTACH